MTTFRQQPSSGKKNAYERYYEIAHEFMKKNGEGEELKIGDKEL